MSHAAVGRPRAETDTWVRSTFQVLVGVPGVRRVGVALAEGGGRRLLFTASDRDNERAIDWCEVDAYEDVPLNSAVRSGRMIIGSFDDLADRYPEFVERQSLEMHAIASVPFSAAGHVLGGFALFYGTDQPFDGAQVDALRSLGERLGEDLRRVQPSRTFLTRSLSAEPVPPGARAAILVVGPELPGVGPARQFIRDTLAAWDVTEDSMDSAVVCVSELVTNAVIHTVAGCEVRLVLSQGVLTLTVRDGGTGVVTPQQFAEDPLAVRGRGLQIVDALSTGWGAEVDSVGTTVWCDLDVE
jgi:hypothetical protein